MIWLYMLIAAFGLGYVYRKELHVEEFYNNIINIITDVFPHEGTGVCTKTCGSGQRLDAVDCVCIPDGCNRTCPAGTHLDSNCNCIPDIVTGGKISYVYDRKFGSKGNGPGQFQDPHDISFDRQGNAFIPDRVRNDVQVFDHSGKYLRKFGGPGTGNGKFDVPYSTAHDPQDNFYVSDRGNNRVQKLTHDGAFIKKITSAGGKSLKAPEDIAFDFVNGDWYLADTGNERIVKFDKNDNFLLQWGSKGNGNGKFDHPHAIDVGTDRNVYVSCGHLPYIQKFSPTGQFIKQWGSEGNGPGQVRLFLEHLDIDKFGRLHLINNDVRPIVNVWDQNGNWLTQYGNTSKGSANGQFNEPEHVTVDDSGYPWVVDSGNFRIQIFRPVTSAYTRVRAFSRVARA